MPLIRKTFDKAPAEPRDIRLLEAALAGGSPDERWTAARAISNTAAGLSSLAQALARETDPRVREALFTGLARIATPASAAAVLPFLRSDDAAMRTGALDALMQMPDACKSHLGPLLADPDSDVRLLACEIARKMQGPEAMPLLCKLLETEQESNVCAAAVDVLAEIGNSGALPSLTSCAQRFKDNPFLAFAIKVTVDRLRSQSPVPSE